MYRSSAPAMPFGERQSSPERSPLGSNREGSKRNSFSRSLSQTVETSSFSVITVDQCAELLESSLTNGLSPAEAAARLYRHGPNELKQEEPEPLWLRFLKQFKETLILLLLGSAVVSFLMGNFEDALSITIAVIIVVTVGFVQEYRSEKSLEALSQLVPHFSHVVRLGPPTDRTLRASSTIRSESPKAASDLGGRAEKAGSPGDRISLTIPASDLVRGDLVLFRLGDRIPADIRITRAVDLSIDESNLTGEAEPVEKTADHMGSQRSGPVAEVVLSPNRKLSFQPADDADGNYKIRLNDQHNVAFMGTLVRSGHGEGLVIGTGERTEFGSISSSLQEIESPRTPLQLSMDRIGKELSYISFGVIGFIMLLGLWRGWKFIDMFQIGVSLAVAAIPEGLPIVVTVTLALGVLRMSKRNAIVRRLPSVETLGSVNIVCSDKTGTLTLNHMTATKVWSFGGSIPIDLKSNHNSAGVDPALQRILRIGNVANNARHLGGTSDSSSARAASVLSSMKNDETISKSRWFGQPTDVALLDLLDSVGEEDVRTRAGQRVQEVSFSSERKWMGVVTRSTSDADHGASVDTANVKGALEQIISMCDTYTDSQGHKVVLDESRRQEASRAADHMAKEGLRVLAFASGTVVHLSSTRPSIAFEQAETHQIHHSQSDYNSLTARDKLQAGFEGLTFAGLVGMYDPPRKGVDRSIRRLVSGGVKVVMITGDSVTTAVAIATKLGLPVTPHSSTGTAVLRGADIDRMTEKQLSEAIGNTYVFARTSPEHKLKIIRAYQMRGNVIAMTGDGVNDAPALKKADIGISMGRVGTDVAKEAADMVLTDDNFSTILSAMEEGKGIFYNIQNFLTFQLSTSAAALSLVLVSTMFGLPNPLNAMQILWINILMDGPPAQSLGVEPVDPAIMSRPPRPKNARVLTRAVLSRVLQSASVIMLGTLLTYIREMAADGKVTARDTTMTFTCFVLFDMFNALTCRSEAKSVLWGEIGLFSNKMFNYAVAGSLLGQAFVIYMPFLQRIFQTEALSLQDLVYLLAIASCVFWVDEARKFIKRRRLKLLPGYSLAV